MQIELPVADHLFVKIKVYRREETLKKLLVYLKGYGKECVMAPLFKMLEAFWDLLVPLVVADIIDIGIAGNNRGYIWQRFAILLLLAAVGLACSFTAQYFAAKASTGFSAKVRQALFDHVQGLSYTELDRLGTDTLITRLTSDVQQVQNGTNMTLRLLLRSPFIVFGSMIMAFTIDFKSALVFVAAIPALSVVVYGIMLISIPMFRKVQNALDAVTSKTRENLTGVRVIRAFTKEEQETADFDEKNRLLTSLNEHVGRVSALMNPATYVMINIATVVLIYVGAVQVNGGHIGQGSVVALYNYMAQMIVELIKLASLIITINKAIASGDRIEAVLEVKSSMEYSGSEKITAIDQAPETEALRFEDVSFTYDGAGAEALSHISFSAGKGQTVGIIGGTGSGKSTLVSLVSRFYDATEGSVKLGGVDVKNFARGEIMQAVAVVPQKAVLFAGTVRDNLLWGNENASDEQLWAALEAAQAKDVVEGKAGGLDFLIEQGGRNLSGGQRQRLTIARALVKQPRYLILDDSASALDFATDAALRRALKALPGEITTLIVSQRTSSIRHADLILVLSDGLLAGSGTHEELLESCEVYREIYASQFPEEAARAGIIPGEAGGQRPGAAASGMEEEVQA